MWERGGGKRGVFRQTAKNPRQNPKTSAPQQRAWREKGSSDPLKTRKVRRRTGRPSTKGRNGRGRKEKKGGGGKRKKKKRKKRRRKEKKASIGWK